MMDTVSEPRLVTYTNAPSGVPATLPGNVSTGTNAATGNNDSDVVYLDTPLSFACVTYTKVLSAVTVTPVGPAPERATVVVTRFVAVSMRDSVSLAKLVTYTAAPSGETATPRGSSSTSMVAVTRPAATSMTDTSPEPSLATYA